MASSTICRNQLVRQLVTFMIVCLVVLVAVSVADLHPFGNVRYSTRNPESPALYNSVETELSKASGRSALFLFVAIQTAFYNPIEAMLSRFGFEFKESYHGRSKHLYIYHVSDPRKKNP